ncbi:MAG: hypothetical protein KAX49_03370 [Halanaerobiales bacterium]|nr:hypothetical protein [Halanaerobiales bacterium]
MRNDLLNDARDALDESIEVLSLSIEESVGTGIELTEEKQCITIPVPGGWQIILLSTLKPNEKVEVTAHELGHLLLKGEGLFAVSCGDKDEPETILVSEMNNVIFHHFVINRLVENYKISSNMHLDSRKNILKNGHELIKEYRNETIILHRIGLHLLDLAITTTGKDKRIGELVNLSERVKEAFEIGQELLVYPDLNLPPGEQWRRIKEFLERLGYDASKAHLSGS